MLLYIIKFSACLGILLLFYTFFLEREKMHVFKRFYLLGALVFSLVVPQLVFTEYVVVEPTPDVVVQPITPSTDVIEIPPALETDVLDVAPVLWGIYFLGLIFFGLNFIKNLIQVYRRIKTNPKERKVPFVRVLLQENFPPHTFFNYIFLNKVKLESKEIPEAVLLHEETHAKQKHSIDVLFIELLQVVMWFNPLVYFAKKSIKLNHEFLADSAVLQKGTDSSTYQNTLLSFMTPNYKEALVNSINYSSIKKRFTVMKKRTSKKSILVRSFLLLPLLAILLYSFSQRTFEESFLSEKSSRLISDIYIEIDGEGNLSLNDKDLPLNDISKAAQQINPHCTTGELKNFVTGHIIYNENQVGLIKKVESQLQKVGIHNINHVSKRTSTILGRADFVPSKYHRKTIEEARAIQKETISSQVTVWFDIKNENEIWLDDKLIELKDLATAISQNHSTKSVGNELKVQFYATGVLRSSFVDKLNIEARKASAKEVQVFTEEYIMPEDEFIKEANDVKNKITEQAPTSETIQILINKEGQLLVQNDQIGTLKNLKNHLLKFNTHLSKEERQEIVRAKIVPDPKAPKSLIDDVEIILKEYGVAMINIVGPEDLPSPTQDGASRKQMAEYNKLAKKYNEMDSNHMKILKKDVERLKYIYDAMSDKQRADAEPFPDFPEPPPAPNAPKSPKAPNEREEASIKIKQIIEEQDPYDVVGGHKLSMTQLDSPPKSLKGEVGTVPPPPPPVAAPSSRVLKGEASEVPPPPPPPEPQSPLDHVIEMAKKGATFYYEGNEISSDRAIQILKENDKINIDSRGSKSKKPIVKLSTEPIVIEN